MLSLRSGFKPLALGLLLQAAPVVAQEPDCIPLERVDIDDAQILSHGDQRELVEPFLGACIDAALIRQIMARISGEYIDRGYVTTRPYLLEQDINDGQIEIRVIVGTIEAVVDAASGKSSPRIATAFAFGGEILNLRKLETALEVIERAASAEASFAIRPGTTQGASIVEISLVDDHPLHLELGINGQTDLDTQLSLQATLDNPFNINDIVSFRANSGELQRAYQSNRSRELSYSIPLGATLLELGLGDVRFEQRVQGINDSFLSTGNAQTRRLGLSRVLTRSRTGKLSLALDLELKDSENLFAGQLVDVSSYRTSQLQLELRHDWLQGWGQLATRYRFQQGLDSFGARDDDYFTLQDGFGSEAQLQFEKLVIDSNLLYYLDKSDWQAGVQLYLQYSDDILFASDQLSLGSPYTVRGYSSALSGSNAWYLRAELRRQLLDPAAPSDGPYRAKSITLAVGLDYGEARCEIDNPDVCGEIYGLSLGAVVSDANFSGRLLWGHPLKKLGAEIGDQDQFLLDLRWLF